MSVSDEYPKITPMCKTKRHILYKYGITATMDPQELDRTLTISERHRFEESVRNLRNMLEDKDNWENWDEEVDTNI